MKVKIGKEIDTYAESLRTSVDEVQVSKIMDWCSNPGKRVASLTKEKQKQKYERLYQAHQPQRLDPQSVVRNISSRTLSDDKQEPLALGLNFSKTPRQIPYNTIIAATEATCKQLKSDDTNRLRTEVSSALSKAKPPKRNIEKRLQRAITNLEKDNNIVILPADKGNATVVMDREGYRKKIMEHLDDSTYRKLKTDPTAKIEKRISQSLKTAEKNGWISDKSQTTPHPPVLVTPADLRATEDPQSTT